MPQVFSSGRALALGALLGLFLSAAGCSGEKSQFAGKSSKLQVKNAQSRPQGENLPDSYGKPGGEGDTGTPGRGETQFQGNIPDARSTFGKKDIWTVTIYGKVKRFSLSGIQEGDVSEDYVESGHWELEGGASGHRTFVSEIGLLVGKTGSGIFRVGHDTPSGTRISRTWGSNEVGGSRVCVTSFQVAGKRYVGAGFNTDGGRIKFVKIPIDMGQASKMNLASARIIDTGAQGSWGYSCFTDQARSTFWGMQGNIHGFNFATDANVSAPPNGWDEKNIVGQFSTKNRKAYALAGDSQGRLLNTDSYTAAFEEVSGAVFISQRSSSRIRVVKDSCLDGAAACALNNGVWDFDLGPLGVESLGPLSSLNDGHVVGLGRGDPGNIFLLSLKDHKDPSKGIAVKKVGEAGGDPYMYSDFTGATLYAAEIEKTLSLKPEQGFVKDKIVRNLKMTWKADSGTAEPWRGLALEVRCYASGGAKPGFTRLESVPAAGQSFEVTAPGCQDAHFDQVDIHLVPLNTSGGFSHTSSFEVAGSQEG